MKTIKLIIERSKDAFWAYAKNEEGITGGGSTVAACKQDVLDCIETMKKFNAANKPAFLKAPYKLVFKFDGV